MSKTNSGSKNTVGELHKEFPSVSKSIIENELRKADGDMNITKKSLKELDKSIATLNEIILCDKKKYVVDDDSDQEMDSEDSKESSDDKDSDKDVNFIKNTEYESQDESESEEIDKICTSTTAGKPTPDFVDDESEQFFDSISIDLMQQFPGVPKECVSEIVKYFYPNMGKIESVLGEFQKQLYYYMYDNENHRKGRKERVKKLREKKHKKEFVLTGEMQQIVDEVNELKERIKSQKGSLTKEEIKELKSKIKDLKHLQKAEKKNLKQKQKEERKLLKTEAKKAKEAKRLLLKEEKYQAKLEESKKRGEKDYEDDVFFREIRREPEVIKQVIKETKRNIKKATKEGNEEEVKFYQNKLEEYQKSLEDEVDKVITLTYERYNKPEQAANRLDLHGLRRKEALRLLERILNIRIKQINENYGNIKSRDPFEFNIVTGRGNHGGKSVLKPAVKNYLIDQGIKFVEFSNQAGFTAQL